jgi:uncharacterized protein (TIGR02271 family)
MEKLQKKVEDIEDTIIPLIGEKSDESRNIKVDQTTLTKEPVIETKTVQVPLVHEDVTIEKRPPNNKTKAQPPAASTKNMAVPIKKEETDVTKIPYVTEEVVVKKKPVTETKEITSEYIEKFDENSDTKKTKSFSFPFV